MIRFAYNPTTQPVDIDPEGHQRAGQSWGPVEDDHPQVQAAYARGALVDSAPPDGKTPLTEGAQDGWDAYQAALDTAVDAKKGAGK